MPQWRPNWPLVLAPGKNVNPMALATSGTNVVFFEEFEPNSRIIALTPLTIYNLRLVLTVNSSKYVCYCYLYLKQKSVHKNPVTWLVAVLI